MTGSDVTRNVGPDKPTACLVAEVIGNSPKSFHAAIDDALERLGPTRIHGIDVLAQKISFSNEGAKLPRRVEGGV